MLFPLVVPCKKASHVIQKQFDVHEFHVDFLIIHSELRGAASSILSADYLILPVYFFPILISPQQSLYKTTCNVQTAG